MKDGYQQLVKYIRPVDERNRDLAISKLLGVSITKQFIPSIANIVGTDLSNYKIVRTGQFAYGSVTSRNGEKISVALLEEDDCIISRSYTVFEVIDKNELNPEYLMLWFSRPEFDRYARYRSHGSVREIFDWDEMCQVELPVPDIDKQNKIVDAYRVITDRIVLKQKINHNLHHEMDRGCKLSGVKRIRVHDLRHSHVVYLIEQGFSPVVIAERLGHENISITLNYAHLYPSKQLEIIETIEKERN